jgi:UDP-3-O-[3-hydroxymyristoyl] N-acetylglucosamine deacetylase
MDGSAMPFTDLIRFAGIKEQAGPRCFFVIKDTIEIGCGDKFVCAYPASSFKITCTIDFPHPAIKNQTLTIDVTEDVFEKEIAPSRTFGFIHEIEYLIKHGFAKGGSLDNTIVLDQNGILNENPLRYPDEFVRHKILDCIGDFSLLGMPILGHIVLKKSGHAFNHAFINEFFKKKGSWETLTIYDFNDVSWNLPKALAI